MCVRACVCVCVFFSTCRHSICPNLKQILVQHESLRFYFARTCCTTKPIGIVSAHLFTHTSGCDILYVQVESRSSIYTHLTDILLSDNICVIFMIAKEMCTYRKRFVFVKNVRVVKRFVIELKNNFLTGVDLLRKSNDKVHIMEL